MGVDSGKYPNVPLVGTKCCINYNPVLAQRQFGYVIKGAPTPAVLAPLLSYYEDGLATEILHQIKNARKSVNYMERESRSWALNREIPYRQWMAERVERVKLPFRLISPNPTKGEPKPEDESEEVKWLNTEIERLKEKILN